MKTHMEEMMEQLGEMVDPAIKLSQVLYEKMADNASLLKGVAKFHKNLVDALMTEGFSREEAINMTIHAMQSLSNSKK